MYFKTKLGERKYLLLAGAFKKWCLEIELWWLGGQGIGFKIQWGLPAQVRILLTAFLSEIKRCWLLGRKTTINLDSVLKSRDVTLPTNVRIVKAMVSPVVMYECEIWTIKKTGHWKIDAFELWCWRRLMRVPWTARRSKQEILKEIKDWSWSWSSNTLAIWCKEPTHWKRPWCWERLRAAEGGNRGWDGWMASLTQWTWVWAPPGDGEGQGI